MARDDIIIRPRLEDRARAAAPTRAREERRTARGVRKGRMFRRMAKSAATRRVLRGGKRARKVARGTAGRAHSVAAARSGGRAAAGGIGGLAVTTVVLAAMAASRLLTGKSFQNMGAQVNKVLLGDLDEQARASAQTREHFRNDPRLAEVVGREGRVNAQVSSVFKDLKRIRQREIEGDTLFREDDRFQNNSTMFDQLIVRGADAIQKGWDGADGDGRVGKLQSKYRASIGDGSAGVSMSGSGSSSAGVSMGPVGWSSR